MLTILEKYRWSTAPECTNRVADGTDSFLDTSMACFSEDLKEQARAAFQRWLTHRRDCLTVPLSLYGLWDSLYSYIRYFSSMLRTSCALSRTLRSALRRHTSVPLLCARKFIPWVWRKRRGWSTTQKRKLPRVRESSETLSR